MILFQINPPNFTLFPLESDAPRAVNMNSVPGGDPLKGMEVKPWYV
jgi:hypothetical protein